jgi:hypothetical protein
MDYTNFIEVMVFKLEGSQRVEEIHVEKDLWLSGINLIYYLIKKNPENGQRECLENNY